MAKEQTAKNGKKTATTETNTVSLLQKGNVSEHNFDTIYNLDEKELHKKVSYDQKKNGKRLQLANKISVLDAEISKTENRYLMSLTDPTVDSVELKIEIRVLKEEKQVAFEIYNQLFPEHAQQGN